jgi:hypothetical protein
MTNSYPNFVTKRYLKFISNLKGKSLQDYFDIKIEQFNSSDYKLKFTMNKVDEDILLNVLFIKKCTLFNFTLPIELIRIINSYANDKIDITFKITFPRSYPFTPPYWMLIRLNHNFVIEQPLSIEEHYKFIIKTHNFYNNKKIWSPATDIEKDILLFISRINHFEYLLEHKK